MGQSRRQFLATTATGLAGILATKTPPAVGQQREISYLCWNNFAPASDKKLAEIGQRFTKDTGIKLKIDHISHMGPQQQKLAAEVQTQAGHDLVELRMHFAWLYEPQLADVSDVVAELEKKHGKVISSGVEASQVNGVWRSVPMYHGLFVAAYREDLFKKGGLKVPDTWEDLYTVGKELKKMGHPVGIPIAQNYDSISTAGPVLWSFGGMEVDKDGKTVRINSPQAAEAIEWYKKVYRDCMEPEVLSWTDASNNESMQQGKASWIHNPVSAYIVAKQRKLPTADVMNHHKSLGGPQGRHETDVPRGMGIWKFSKNIEPAKEWIRYLRVDRGYSIVDRDADSGYLLFEFPVGRDSKGSGSLEAFRATDDAGRPSVNLQVSTDAGPSHLPTTIVDGIAQKVKAERGQPAPPPPKEPAPPKPKESDDPPPLEEPHHGEDPILFDPAM